MNIQKTILPRTANVQIVGYSRDRVRVVSVDLYSSVACTGGPLHLAHGLRFNDGSGCSWFVTQREARDFGWL